MHSFFGVIVAARPSDTPISLLGNSFSFSLDFFVLLIDAVLPPQRLLECLVTELRTRLVRLS